MPMPFSIPLPRGSTQAERQQLLHDWLASEVWANGYNARIRAYQASIGGVPDATVKDANGKMVQLRVALDDARRMIDSTIRDLRSQGRWGATWPQSAREVVAVTMEVLGGDAKAAGLGLWPLVIAAVLIALAAAVAIASIGYPLVQVHKIIESMPALPDIETGLAIGGAAMLALGLGAAWLIFGRRRA